MRRLVPSPRGCLATEPRQVFAGEVQPQAGHSRRPSNRRTMRKAVLIDDTCLMCESPSTSAGNQPSARPWSDQGMRIETRGHLRWRQAPTARFPLGNHLKVRLPTGRGAVLAKPVVPALLGNSICHAPRRAARTRLAWWQEVCRKLWGRAHPLNWSSRLRLGANCQRRSGAESWR